HLAARPVDAAVAGARIGLGLVAPVDRRVGEGLAEAERDVNPAVRVLAAGLQQRHAGVWVLAEPGCHGAAGGPGADHDEIRLNYSSARLHRVPPPLALFRPVHYSAAHAEA